MNWYKTAQIFDINHWDAYQSQQAPKDKEAETEARMQSDIHVIIMRHLICEYKFESTNRYKNQPRNVIRTHKTLVPFSNISISTSYSQKTNEVELNIHINFKKSAQKYIDHIKKVFDEKNMHKEIEKITGVEPNITYELV